MKIFYYQAYLEEQDTHITDTVEFTVPTITTPEQVAMAVDYGVNAVNRNDYDDRVEYVDNVFIHAAEKLGGMWRYLDITGVLVVSY